MWEQFSNAFIEIGRGNYEKVLLEGTREITELSRRLEVEHLLGELFSNYSQTVRQYEIGDTQIQKEYLSKLYSETLINLPVEEYLKEETLTEPVVKRVFREFPELIKELSRLRITDITQEQWQHFSRIVCDSAETVNENTANNVLKHTEKVNLAVRTKMSSVSIDTLLEDTQILIYRHQRLIEAGNTPNHRQFTESDSQTHSRLWLYSPQEESQEIIKAGKAEEIYDLSQKLIQSFNLYKGMEQKFSTDSPDMRNPGPDLSHMPLDMPDIFADSHPAALEILTGSPYNAVFSGDDGNDREKTQALSRMYMNARQENAAVMMAFPEAIHSLAQILSEDAEQAKPSHVRSANVNAAQAPPSYAYDNIPYELVDHRFMYDEIIHAIYHNGYISEETKNTYPDIQRTAPDAVYPNLNTAYPGADTRYSDSAMAVPGADIRYPNPHAAAPVRDSSPSTAAADPGGNASGMRYSYEESHIQYAVNLVHASEGPENISNSSSGSSSGSTEDAILRLAPSLGQAGQMIKKQDAEIHSMKETLTLQEQQMTQLLTEQDALRKRLTEQEESLRQQPEDGDIYGRMLWKLQSDLRLERMRRGMD